MGSAKTPYAGAAAVIDLEAGPATAEVIKSAALVAETFYDNREYARIDADLTDHVLDEDTTLTRARRDRDRAFPRDVSHPKPRKSRRLPALGEFRSRFSNRQRRERSALKHQIHRDAPQTQHRALGNLIGNPHTWETLNRKLSQATGNVQHLDATDRETIQRIDRVIQSYEDASDRGHLVYVPVSIPLEGPITSRHDVPDTLQPGARISFDQFTMASHSLAEAHDLAAQMNAADPDGDPIIILEIETSRGLYLGRSDSLDDTSHLLPRGMALQVEHIDTAADFATSSGGHDRTLCVQLSDSPRPPDYKAPTAARQVLRHNRAQRKAIANSTPPKET